MSSSSKHETSGPLRLLTGSFPLKWWKDAIESSLQQAEGKQRLILEAFCDLIQRLEQEEQRRGITLQGEQLKTKYIKLLEFRIDQLQEILAENDMLPAHYLSRQEIALRLASKYRLN